MFVWPILWHEVCRLCILRVKNSTRRRVSWLAKDGFGKPLVIVGAVCLVCCAMALFLERVHRPMCRTRCWPWHNRKEEFPTAQSGSIVWYRTNGYGAVIGISCVSYTIPQSLWRCDLNSWRWGSMLLNVLAVDNWRTSQFRACSLQYFVSMDIGHIFLVLKKEYRIALFRVGQLSPRVTAWTFLVLFDCPALCSCARWSCIGMLRGYCLVPRNHNCAAL